MRLRFRSGILLTTLGLALVFMTAPAWANIPNSSLSTVPNVIVEPGGLTDYTVTIVGQLGPVHQALVELIFSPAADTLLCWCDGQTHPVITGLTDPNGDVVFNISGGGCIDPALLPGGVAVEVFANGFKMAEVGVVSADAVDSSGNLTTEGWNPVGSCSVGLSDATYFSQSISTGVYEFCADLNSDGSVGLEDGVMLTQPITSGIFCTQAP